jgi:hypothetical protein
MTRNSAFSGFTPYQNNGDLAVEERWSINHARLSGGRWSGGGPFILNRNIQEFIPSQLKFTRYSSTGNTLLTEGTCRIETPTTGIPVLEMPHIPSDLELDALGTTAIARTEPTNPAFDLSVFLGELRAEGLPNLPGTAMMEKTRLAKAGGSEYLNVEFGWMPMLRGLRDFAGVVENSDKITRSYQEQANHVIKRSYQWPTIEDSRADACQFAMTPAVGFFSGGGQHQSVMQRKWFEVDYIYYLPTGGAFNDKIRRYASYARKLYGIDLSPEVLWNLAPWSWAADWFGNVGDVMHNISALGQDGLVMQNGSVMCHTSRVTTRSGTYTNSRGGQFTQTSIRTEESKLRRGATPFGFGVDFGSLSPKQLAIISALGLSRW